MPFQWQFQNDPLPHWFSHIFRLLCKHQSYRESQYCCHTGTKLAYAKWQMGQRAFLFDPHQKVRIISTTIYPETHAVSSTDSSDPGQHIPGTCSQLFPTRSNLKGGCSQDFLRICHYSADMITRDSTYSLWLIRRTNETMCLTIWISSPLHPSKNGDTHGSYILSRAG
jgi:hypothetical protein